MKNSENTKEAIIKQEYIRKNHKYCVSNNLIVIICLAIASVIFLFSKCSIKIYDLFMYVSMWNVSVLPLMVGEWLYKKCSRELEESCQGNSERKKEREEEFETEWDKSLLRMVIISLLTVVGIAIGTFMIYGVRHIGE